MPTPLLILSDAPTAGSGLGRITCDLATRISAHLPEFRVATLGYGGPYSRHLPFPQYDLEMRDWVAYNLPDVWDDFCGDEKGILMTIWDASRLLWLSRPEHCPDPILRKWLHAVNPTLWGYFPIDATGPHDKLTAVVKYTIEGFDRVLAYSEWARQVLQRTSPTLDVHQLPHGIDTSVFYPRPRVQARHGFGQRLGAKWVKGKKAGQFMSIPDDVFLFGIVATNQIRKDWALGFQTVAEIAKERRVMLWCKVDQRERHWSLDCLINDYGLADSMIMTAGIDFSDDQMAWSYSACDVTLGIGIGEGFGFPIFESLACGTPCIHGKDGGAWEHMPEWMLVNPVATRMEGLYNCRRNVYDPVDWAAAVRRTKDKTWDFPRHLDWDNLWPCWTEWLKAGLP